MGDGPRNLESLSTIYGPTTWDVYERLDVTLEPRGPDMLYDIAAAYIGDRDLILDAGCRDAHHLIELVRRHPGITGVGVEPVAVHVDRARQAVDAAQLNERITVHEGVLHDVPVKDGTVDFVWCRDVLVQVDDLVGGLEGLHRVMRPNAHLLSYCTFMTERLDGADLEMMRRHLGWLEENVRRANMESGFAQAGFVIEAAIELETEWREYAEERTQPASRSLLRLARLRRQRDAIVEWRGQAIYDHIEANLHYEIFLFLGKLTPVVHLLGKKN